MLKIIITWVAFAFAIIYPLVFWISFRDPLKENFHRFHIGLPAVIGTVLTLILWQDPNITYNVKQILLIWSVAMLTLTALFWKRVTVSACLVTLAVLPGWLAYVLWQMTVMPDVTPAMIYIGLWHGLIFSAALYAMNLGHWYLNVHGLDHSHLRRAIVVLAILIALRLVWDIGAMLTARVIWLGEPIPLWQWALNLDGVFLWVALLFGTIFPLFTVVMAYKTLQLGNTQATTGILYVLLCGVVLGDMAYRYHILKLGLPI